MQSCSRIGVQPDGPYPKNVARARGRMLLEQQRDTQITAEALAGINADHPPSQASGNKR